MYVLSTLKINSFSPVSIPKPRELFGRFGLSNKPSDGYTGDDSVKAPGSKVEQAAEVMNDIPKEDK